MGEKTIRKKWLNAEEAADYLSLPSWRAVHQAARRSGIPRYRFGSRIRYSIDDLDALMVPDTMNSCTAEIDLDVDGIIRDMAVG